MNHTPQNLEQWLAWMESHHPRSIDLGLERVAAVLARMQLDLSGCRVITVAGTNGKGSCVAAAVAALTAAGFRVGSYTSPHLVHYNERVCIDGQAVDDATLCQGFEQVYAAQAGDSLTYFEFGTLAALACFAAAAVDFIVLEVGLGGRLDAVNVIDADVAVVTSIDLDHSDWLGNDREQVGREKAGIARRDRPLLCADPVPPASIGESAAACGAELLSWGSAFGADTDTEGQWCFWGCNHQRERIELRTSPPKLAAGSVAAALQALLSLDIALTPPVVQAALRVQLPGRFQRCWLDGVEIILDVAHNPAAATNLAGRLKPLPHEGRTAAVFGIMSDKDVEGVIQALKPQVDAWFLAELKEVPRAVPAADLAARIHACGIHMISVSKNLRQAWRRALSLLGPGDRLLVCGSFHVVGPVLSWLDRDGAQAIGEGDGGN